MTDTPAKLFSIICVLLGVWIVTYWLYQPTSAQPPGDPRLIEPAFSPVTVPAPKPQVSPPVERRDLAPLPIPKPAPTPVEPPKTRKVQKLVKPQFREYTVQRGDTSFKAIAARREVYGDGSKAAVIAKANPFVSPDRLKIGKTVLQIPVDPDNVQGKIVEVDEPVLPHSDPPPPAQPAAASELTYTITRDDTLWEISKRFYGKGGAWQTIYEANKDRIPDPDRPPAGVTIRIPPAP